MIATRETTGDFACVREDSGDFQMFVYVENKQFRVTLTPEQATHLANAILLDMYVRSSKVLVRTED